MDRVFKYDSFNSNKVPVLDSSRILRTYINSSHLTVLNEAFDPLPWELGHNNVPNTKHVCHYEIFMCYLNEMLGGDIYVL